MPSVPTLTTELEAINMMLSTISEAPVNSLSGANNADVAFARQTLAELLKAVLAEGWHFNTEKDFPLSRAEDNTITVGPDMISVDVDNNADIDVVLRGQRLYDKKNHRYTFESNLEAEVVFLLPFNEIPEVFRQYIAILAARKFADRAMGSEVIHKFTDADEADAREAIERYEANTGDYSIFNNSDVALIIARVPRPWP